MDRIVVFDLDGIKEVGESFINGEFRVSANKSLWSEDENYCLVFDNCIVDLQLASSNVRNWELVFRNCKVTGSVFSSSLNSMSLIGCNTDYLRITESTFSTLVLTNSPGSYKFYEGGNIVLSPQF